MRIVFNIVSIIIVVCVTFFAALNTQTVFDFTIWGSKSGGHGLIYHASLVQVILWAFVAGTVAGVLWAASFYSPMKTKLKEFQEKLEKTSNLTDEECSKVAVLEEKIKTLETALQSKIEPKE